MAGQQFKQDKKTAQSASSQHTQAHSPAPGGAPSIQQMPGTPQAMLQLQRMVGNRATHTLMHGPAYVQRLMNQSDLVRQAGEAKSDVLFFKRSVKYKRLLSAVSGYDVFMSKTVSSAAKSGPAYQATANKLLGEIDKAGRDYLADHKKGHRSGAIRQLLAQIGPEQAALQIIASHFGEVSNMTGRVAVTYAPTLMAPAAQPQELPATPAAADFSGMPDLPPEEATPAADLSGMPDLPPEEPAHAADLSGMPEFPPEGTEHAADLSGMPAMPPEQPTAADNFSGMPEFPPEESQTMDASKPAAPTGDLGAPPQQASAPLNQTPAPAPGAGGAKVDAQEVADYCARMRNDQFHWTSKMGRFHASEAMDKSFGKLDQAQKAAICLYTADDFMYINPIVHNRRDLFKDNLTKLASIKWKDPARQEFKAANENDALVDGLMQKIKVEVDLHVKMMQAGLANMDPLTNTPVYRGELRSKEDIDKTFVPGKEIPLNTYTSTARAEIVAYSFLSPNPKQGFFNVMEEIQCLKGYYINDLSAHDNEEEVLLPPGSVLRVDSIVAPDSPAGEYTIKMTQIK